MTIQTNTTDRKALAWAIAEELHTDCRYMRAPTYAYQVGDFIVDRDGNIVGDDFTALRDFLLRNGYNIAEDPDAEVSDEEDDAPDAVIDDDVPGAATAECDESTEPDGDAPNTAEGCDESTEHIGAADFVAPRQADDSDVQTITIPAVGITVEQLRNLTYMLYSRQYILNLMTGGQTIAIPVELIEALQEALPATPEDFTALLDSHRELGLKGYDYRDGQFSLTFPFYETEPTKWTTCAGLQGRILLAARTATRVLPELIRPDEEAEKYTAHIWLQRMGYKGAEMKEQRNILLKHLHGYCAFSNGAKMQNHKDKYSAIRRERREAGRDTERSIAPVNTEAATPVVAPEKEVASND